MLRFNASLASCVSIENTHAPLLVYIWQTDKVTYYFNLRSKAYSCDIAVEDRLTGLNYFQMCVSVKKNIFFKYLYRHEFFSEVIYAQYSCKLNIFFLLIISQNIIFFNKLFMLSYLHFVCQYFKMIATRPPPLKIGMMTKGEGNMGRHFDLAPFKADPDLHQSFFGLGLTFFQAKAFLIWICIFSYF